MRGIGETPDCILSKCLRFRDKFALGFAVAQALVEHRCENARSGANRCQQFIFEQILPRRGYPSIHFKAGIWIE